jgi:general secretion pathway protein F/type IV pilus assembly protein PilC
MLAALQIARDAAGLPALEKAIEHAADAVRHGQPLARPLAESGLIPDDVLEMVAVGETANNLDAVLLTIADTLDGRIERQLGTAVKLVEPLILMVLAGFVGIVAIALILPMTQMAQTLR